MRAAVTHYALLPQNSILFCSACLCIGLHGLVKAFQVVYIVYDMFFGCYDLKISIFYSIVMLCSASVL